MISRTDPFPYLWACSALGLLYAVVKLLRFGHREKHLPPGPPTWPIIGNAHLTVDPKIFKKQVPTHFFPSLLAAAAADND
ncbi:hypothetical protein PTNB73_06316 [Pyrenophora teres f. teres]|nr:hypothetical protein HRS9122_09531 [Pyrenophora teres f. teres]KAE8863109.1 hypothetical protein PTNB73_06316 [Pyrenophora teres f. teres]